MSNRDKAILKANARIERSDAASAKHRADALSATSRHDANVSMRRFVKRQSFIKRVLDVLFGSD